MKKINYFLKFFLQQKIYIIYEYYNIKIDGNYKLCKDINKNKPYYDVNINQCVSLCDYVMFNNVCMKVVIL